MKQRVLLDTGFWRGIVDEKDQHHNDAIVIAELIDDLEIIVPFPTMYELLRTKFVKNSSHLQKLENYMKNDNVTLLCDEDYRDQALEDTLTSHRRPTKHYSAVDSLIREILTDINLKIDYLATFNDSDFADVCARRHIKII